MAKDNKKPFISRFKIIFVILMIIVIPVIMDQLQMDGSNIRAVGRVCAGLSGIFLIYGILSKMIRLFSIVLIAVIALAVLVSEGVIDLPVIFQ